MEITALPASQSARIVPLLTDLHALHVTHQPERFPADPDPEKLRLWLEDWLNEETIHALVACSPQGAVMGYVVYEIEQRPEHLLRTPERRVMVHQIAVDRVFQRLGIGKSLMTAVKHCAMEQKADTICATFAQFNTASAALMRHMGLQPVTTFAEWRAPQSQPA